MSLKAIASELKATGVRCRIITAKQFADWECRKVGKWQVDYNSDNKAFFVKSPGFLSDFARVEDGKVKCSLNLPKAVSDYILKKAKKEGIATATATAVTAAATAIASRFFKNEIVNELRNDLNEILDGYYTAALWSSTYQGEDPDIDVDEDNDKSFDDLGYDTSAISNKLKQTTLRDLSGFLSHIDGDEKAVAELKKYLNETNASNFGHHFWLSRNGHGAGFFDHRCNTLQKQARSFGEVNLYADAHGKIGSD